jgi:hypothetical protein
MFNREIVLFVQFKFKLVLDGTTKLRVVVFTTFTLLVVNTVILIFETVTPVFLILVVVTLLLIIEETDTLVGLILVNVTLFVITFALVSKNGNSTEPEVLTTNESSTFVRAIPIYAPVIPLFTFVNTEL